MLTALEYKELNNKWAEDPHNEELRNRVIAFNEELVSKYPWLEPRNAWTGKKLDNYDYTWTELDNLCEGWYLEFGLQLCEELDKALGKYRDQYEITEIKEKYGTLRWYDFGNTEEGLKVINKYEKRSGEICQCCGKPATKVTKGWVGYFCDDCFPDKDDVVDESIDISHFGKDTFF